MAFSRVNVWLKGAFSDVEYTTSSRQGESTGMKVEISSSGWFRHHPYVYLEGLMKFTTRLVNIVKIPTGHLHNKIKQLHWAPAKSFGAIQ